MSLTSMNPANTAMVMVQQMQHGLTLVATNALNATERGLLMLQT